MSFKLLSVMIIAFFVFSTGSAYFSQLAFADDPWSDIASRQQVAEEKAMAKYMNSYQFANMDQSKRNWDGLTSTSTDETSRGRNLEVPQQISLQNAVEQFDAMHTVHLANLTSGDYKGIFSIPTDTQGRDRDDMLENSRASSLVQAQDVLDKLVKIQQNYVNFAESIATDTNATYDRQTQIEKNMNDAELQAADLVNQLAKIDGVYIDLSQYVDTTIPYTYKPGSITNEMTHGGRNLTPQEAYSLEKAIMLFNEIHDKHLAALKSNYYGLADTPTDTQGRDRGAMLEEAKSVSLDHALRVYNAYYHGVGLK